MDNSNNLSSSILQTSEPSMASLDISSSVEPSDTSGFFDSLSNITLTTWLIIFLILAFLGFNIFVYLAKGTQDITSFFAPLIDKIFGASVSITGQTVDVAAEGAKAVVGGSANIINTGLTSVQNITPNGVSASSSLPKQSINEQQDVTTNNTLNKALNTSQQLQQGGSSEDYEAHEASSSVHSAGKAGWCFVGEDRGFRTCAEVGVNDDCMSGDIFPSQELCVNPNLRS